MSTVECPNCGNPGATKVLWKVKCPNPACPYFDASVTGRGTHALPADTVELKPMGGAPAGDTPPGRPLEAPPSPGPAGVSRGTILFVILAVLVVYVVNSRHMVTALIRSFFVMWVARAVLKPRTAPPASRHRDPRTSQPHRTPAPRVERPPDPPFDASGDRHLEVRFRNFRKEEKVFTADRTGARWRRNHLLVRVAPKGIRIALNRDRIENLPEVQAAVR